MSVDIGRLYLEYTLAQLQNGDIKCSTAEIEYSDLFIFLLVKAVGQRRRGGFVDNTPHIQTGDLAGILGGLALGIVEIGRHGDHGVGHLGAQVGLGRLADLLQDHGADLRRSIGFIPDFNAHIALFALGHLVGHFLDLLIYFSMHPAHEPLDGVHGAFRIGDCLSLGRLAHQAITILGEGHN